MNEISSVVSPNPPTHCRADPLTFSCSPAALLRTQSVRLHLWTTVCHNYSSPTRNIYGRSAVSTPIHIPPNEISSKIQLGYLYYFFAITFTFYAFVKSENGGVFFQVAVLSLEFQGGTMCNVAHHIWSREPLAASFRPCANYFFIH